MNANEERVMTQAEKMKKYRTVAWDWFRTLSINESKSLFVKYNSVVIDGVPLNSFLVDMYLGEVGKTKGVA